MLGIHTDGTFKPVYPSIPTLMKLTGMSKKGVDDGLRDLEKNGLIIRRSGKSHRRGAANRANIYEFAFTYAGSTLGYLVGKPLATQEPTPLPTAGQTLSYPGTREQESNQREQQQQPTINLNLTLQQNESVAAAALELLKKYFDENAARRIAARYPPDYIQKKVDLVERRARQGSLRNKPGYLRRALEDGWEVSLSEAESNRFAELATAVQAGRVREALIGGIAWRVGITSDRRAVYLTHLTSGSQMRLESWEDCRDIEWR
jgi:hypothetical protein